MSLHTPINYSLPSHKDFRPVETFLKEVLFDRRSRQSFLNHLSMMIESSSIEDIRCSVSEDDSEVLTVALSEILDYCEHTIGTLSFSYLDLLIHTLSNYEDIINHALGNVLPHAIGDDESNVTVVHWCELFSCCYTRHEVYQEHRACQTISPDSISLKSILEQGAEQLSHFIAHSLKTKYLPGQ